MAKFTSWRVGAVTVAAGLLVAACSGGGGGGSGDTGSGGAVGTASNAAPSGIAGGSTSASGSKSASKSAKASGSRSASHSGPSTPAHASSSSRHAGGGGGGGSSSSSSAPVDNGCRSSAPPKASDPSKASITVCKGTGLSDGQTVTITGDHFKPNEGLLFMQCDYKGESANNYGGSDCNINVLEVLNPKCKTSCTSSDSSGHVGPLKLTLKVKFKKIDCSSQQCMVTVAQPVQKDNADNPHVVITFG
jgi:hypothetical protein